MLVTYHYCLYLGHATAPVGIPPSKQILTHAVSWSMLKIKPLHSETCREMNEEDESDDGKGPGM